MTWANRLKERKIARPVQKSNWKKLCATQLFAKLLRADGVGEVLGRDEVWLHCQRLAGVGERVRQIFLLEPELGAERPCVGRGIVLDDVRDRRFRHVVPPLLKIDRRQP